MIRRSFSSKDKDLARELEEIRQMNKRNHQLQRQTEEEESKRQQDEKADAAPEDRPMGSEPPREDAISDFTKEVHNIMSGVQDMETSNMEKGNNDDTMRSPVKKRQGSSKSSSR
jgi:hypothetical protein